MKKIRSDCKDPITYTELRFLTIADEIGKCRPDGNREMDDAASLEANQVWELERHASAERNVYHDTIPMLQRILDNDNYSSVTIGAITNGKGNPFCMTQTLQPYFDFCVSGEDPDVFPKRKPDAGIYQIALQKYKFLHEGATNNKNSADEFIWIHGGDDLANDVGGSAACGALAIWANLGEEYKQTARKRTTASVNDNQQSQPSWSTLNSAELKECTKANNAAKNYITAEIQRLIDLPNVINNILSDMKK